MSKFHTTVLVAIAFGLSAVTASAQSYLDGSSKARGDYGMGFRGGVTQSRPVYQAAPSTQRSYSYEPSTAGAQPAPASNDCGCGAATSAATNAPATTAQKDTGTIRSYSVEPAPGPRYSAPSRSSTPRFLLPKSDSRKFGG